VGRATGDGGEVLGPEVIGEATEEVLDRGEERFNMHASGVEAEGLQGIEGQVGGHQDETSAGRLDEEETQNAVSRFPDQVQDEIAHLFLLLVDESLDGAEVVRARVEQVEECEFLAVDPASPALVRTG